MYVTPAIKPIAMDNESSGCCDIYLYSESSRFAVHNPACGPVIQQFPTCGIAVGGIPAVTGGSVPASLCTIAAQTPVGTVVVTGQ